MPPPFPPTRARRTDPGRDGPGDGEREMAMGWSGLKETPRVPVIKGGVLTLPVI